MFQDHFHRMRLLNKGLLMISVGIGSLWAYAYIFASKPDAEKKVEYGHEVIVDSDFDGLTDQGEEQLYGTDPKNPDTDGDKVYDGVEIVGQSDPLDSESIPWENSSSFESSESIPWSWFFGRAAGIAAFLCMWFSMLLALSVRNPWIKNWFGPLYKMDLHVFLAIAAFFWGMFHGIIFIFDSYVDLSVLEFLVPFYAQTNVVDRMFLGFGIVALYGFLIIGAIALLRRFLPYKVFRASHFLNVPVAILVYWHASKIGTDMKTPWVFWVFVVMNLLLALLWIRTLLAIYGAFRRQSMVAKKNSLKN